MASARGTLRLEAEQGPLEAGEGTVLLVGQHERWETAMPASVSLLSPPFGSEMLGEVVHDTPNVFGAILESCKYLAPFSSLASPTCKTVDRQCHHHRRRCAKANVWCANEEGSASVLIVIATSDVHILSFSLSGA